jgi:hypothetical protein
MATFSSGVKCFRSFLIHSLRYLNGRTLSPFPTEAGHLHDTLLERISTTQWQTINVHIETNRQNLTAKRLRLNESSVSTNLRPGFWWQIEETRQAMEHVIESHFP